MKFIVNKKIYYLLVLSSLLLGGRSYTMNQPDPYPKVGEPCPGLTLDLEHYKVPRVNTKDFEGKWLVLFFWSRYCSSSLKHFEELMKIEGTYGDQLQIITLTHEGEGEHLIDSVYRKTYGYTFPVAYDEKAIDTFGIATFSYVVVVDPTGMIRNISMDLDMPGMQAIMEGKKPALGNPKNRSQQEASLHTYDLETPFLVNGNGGKDTDFLYRSVLSRWKDTIKPYGNYNFSFDKTKREVFVSCADLSRLYRVAYGPIEPMYPPHPTYWEYWYRPELEGISDTTAFGWDYTKTPDLYVYSLVVPDGTMELVDIQKLMQRDLKNYFGYQVKVETRSMPYWSLTASKETERLLKSSGGITHSEGPSIVHYTMINKKVADLLKLIWGYHQEGPPFVDETGITYNIDITLDGIFNDLKSIQKSLARYGLALTLKERDIKVIVISAPE
ncbi:Peroxiredoxin [Pustulibacterium marinum]|uniref:Peroxiredoxin n=1 Tax=Pustulibacterium marinum TaxID=1224947 RepID=A0A1I7IRQ6_9FLAO|nr:redoxin domain-containing protein [Pustulibacterium marinum]SFU75563.1 Peroxiredoxin [Pustulibacterium marinum]